MDSSPERETAFTAVTAGGVVGALLFIIGIESFSCCGNSDG